MQANADTLQAGSGSASINEAQFIQILSRVEHLENRDREQQAEINMLRTSLHIEKEKTSTLENRDREQQAEINMLKTSLHIEKEKTSTLEEMVLRLSTKGHSDVEDSTVTPSYVEHSYRKDGIYAKNETNAMRASKVPSKQPITVLNISKLKN